MTIPFPFRVAVLVAGVVAIVSGRCQAREAEPRPDQPSQVTVSPEMTRFTEPLRSDGTVDYLAAVNARHAAGVTPADNACVLLYEAMGPRPEGSRQPDAFFRLMGIEPLPGEGAYFQSLHAWATGKFPDGSVDVGTLDDTQFEALSRPWTTDEFPLIAAWVEANEVPLRAVVAATERPRYYSPMVVPDGEPDACMFDVLLPGVQASRELSRALAARAMRALGSGREAEAWQDLMAIHRLGRLVGQGPTLIEFLVGVAIESMAIKGELRLLADTQPSADVLAAYREQLDRMPPRGSCAAKVDVSERAMHLDIVQRLADGRTTFAKLAELNDTDAGVGRLDDPAIRSLIDWNAVLVQANAWVDQLVAAGRLPDPGERRRALERHDEDIDAIARAVRERRASLSPRLGGTVITQTVSGEIASTMLPSANAYAGENRAMMLMRGLDLALVLAAYRNDHGGYPESLEMLVPKWVAAVPVDLFTGEPLRYERTAEGYRAWSVGPDGKDDTGVDPPTDDLVVEVPAAAGAAR